MKTYFYSAAFKMCYSSILVLFLLFFASLVAKSDGSSENFFLDVDITSSPGYAVCPGQIYTFTASSSANGCFSWDVYEDGAWVIGL